MPKMGESVMEGTVLEWKKAVGDTVEQDETLLEISTDKVDSEVPSPEAGTLLEILVEEGDTVDVGTPIAVIGSGEPAGDGGGVADAGGAAGAGRPRPATARRRGGTPEPYEKSYSAQSDATADAAPAVQEARGAEAAAAATAGDHGPIPRRDDAGNFYSPLVRSIAETEGLSAGRAPVDRGLGPGRPRDQGRRDGLPRHARRGRGRPRRRRRSRRATAEPARRPRRLRPSPPRRHGRRRTAPPRRRRRPRAGRPRRARGPRRPRRRRRPRPTPRATASRSSR